MNRPKVAALLRAAFGLRSFLARVALIAALLAMPILATAFALVSQVSSDIATATAERTSLARFGRIVDIFTLLERLHDRIDEAHDVPAAAAAVTRSIAGAHRAYLDHAQSAAAEQFWNRLEMRWNRIEGDPTIAQLDPVFDALSGASNELEDDNPVDTDPSSAVQYLATVILRREPHSIANLRQSADAVAAERSPRLHLHAAERTAAQRALTKQALAEVFSNAAFAMSLEPAFNARLGPAVDRARRLTAEYDRRIDMLLATLDRDAPSARGINAAAGHAIDAHLALWQLAQTEVDRSVVTRLEQQNIRRRIIAALSLLAVLLGALGVTLVSRYEARRDRVELAAAKLEGEKLRAEISRMSVERALRLQEAQFRTVFENADLGIAIFDRHGATLQHNTAVREMLGVQTQQFLDGLAPTIAQFESANHEPFMCDESRHSEGQSQWLSLTFSGVYDEDVCQMVILLIRDATEEKLHAQRLAHDATHDSLTGIANRSALDAALRDMLAADRSTNPFTFMYIDLDKFKPINDTFGHHAGDHVLVATAGRLRSVVGADDLCARLGGDEFAIVLRDMADPAAIDAIARRIVASIAAPIPYDRDFELLVTASIGIAIASARHATPDELKRDADVALYTVKERGRNGHLIYASKRPHT